MLNFDHMQQLNTQMYSSCILNNYTFTAQEWRFLQKR